jgi:hypothetical protein
MLRIKLECWWSDTNSLNKRIIRQFVPDEDLDKYLFVESNPDFTIVFGRTDWDRIETPKEKTFYISQEPLWSPNQPKENIHNYCSKIFISDKQDYPDMEEYVEVLLPMFYAGRDENNIEEEWDFSKKIFNKSFEKTNCVSMITTSNYNSHFLNLSNPKTSRIIYQDRTDLSHKLINNFDDIHVWGTFQERNGKNSHGEVWTKLVALKNFKFSISCENTIQKNYISEKFWDCILTETVPIYFGCNNINDFISNDSFINLTDKIDDSKYIEEYIRYVLNNCDSLYEQYLPKIKKLKKQFETDSKFNLWAFIKNEIEKKIIINE